MVPGQLLDARLIHIDVGVVYADGRNSPTHVNAHFNRISAQAALLLAKPCHERYYQRLIFARFTSFSVNHIAYCVI